MIYTRNIWVAFLGSDNVRASNVFLNGPENNIYIGMMVLVFVCLAGRHPTFQGWACTCGQLIQNSEFGFSGRLMRSDAGGV